MKIKKPTCPMMAIDSEASGLALPKTYDQNIGAHN
jgi:hypothetical protein